MSAYIALSEQRSGAKVEFEITPVRIGRAPDNDLVISGEGAGVVSSAHAALEYDGAGWNVTDLGSSNGTLLDGARLAPKLPAAIRNGSVIRLGDTGPQYRVSAVTKRVVAATIVEKAASMSANAPTVAMTATPGTTPAAAQPAAANSAAAPLATAKGAKPGARTATFERQLRDEKQKSARGMRTILIAAAATIVAVAGAAVAYSRYSARQSEMALAARADALARREQATDSLRRLIEADAEQLRGRLAQAESGGASSAIVDSLTKALASATLRTTELETSLSRAEKSVAAQQKAADSVRTASSQELQRLRDELAKTGTAKVASKARDSLQKKLVVAEARSAEVAQIDAKVKASSANLAQLAQLNGPAVGMVVAWFGNKAVTGTGVVVSASGVLITTRRIVREGANEPDSITVMLSGTKKVLTVNELAIAEPAGPDLAVLQIDEYEGPVVQKVDWKGVAVHAGESATIIGVPVGADRAAPVKTLISAGVLATVGADQVQYSALTEIGSSGSPVFNAGGELIAIHQSRLAKGNAAVPIALARKMLSKEMRKELGI